MYPMPFPVMEEHDDRNFRYMNMLPDPILDMAARQGEINKRKAILEYGAEDRSLPTMSTPVKENGKRSMLDIAVYVSFAILVIGVIFLLKKKLL